MRRPYLVLAAVVVVWAGSFSVIKELLDDGVASGDIAIIRYAIAAPGFAYILWRTRGLSGLTRGDGTRIVAAGLAVVVGYHLCLNVGERYTTSGVAALIVALAPALTLLLALPLRLERPQSGRIVGLAVAFAGVAVVVTLGTGQSLTAESAKGPLIVLGAPLCFAFYNVILKPLLGRYDLLALTAAASLVGMLGLIPFVRASTIETVTGPSAGEVLLLLYLGVLATLLGYIAWNVGLRSLGATRAVAFTNANAPLALTFGAVFLDEPVTVWLAVGALFVIAGIATAQGASLRLFRRAGTLAPSER